MIDFAERRRADGQREIAEQMLRTLKRRGPDQDGIYLSKRAVLVHARLSVVDIEGGRQPMKAGPGEADAVLIYNGELYNTEELRRELEGLGHVFRGHSDTEVLLASYLAWGERCPERFNGIFAFAVWDAREQKLFFARDRMGVKPFFYTLADGELIFGSELKSLLAHPAVRPQADLRSVSELLLVGPGRTPGYGVFRGIEELRPGFCGSFSRQGLVLRPYWQIQDAEHPENFPETVEHVRFLVTDAIRRQLVSDVPICTFLSGGLDSGIISALAARELRERGERLKTFTVDYMDNDRYFQATAFQPNSDSQFVGLLRDALNVENITVTIDPVELADALLPAVDARDLPGMADVDSSLLLFCREIKKHATVALSGECADEIFGGYPWYRDEKIRAREGFPWAQSTAFRADFLRDELAEQIDASGYVRALYDATVREAPKEHADGAVETRMREMVKLNMDWFMQTLLDRKDRMSMYSGLEVRVPFCDHRIAEYLYSTPWEFKNYQGREKGMLRVAMEGVLPEEILWRKKSPYPKTWHPKYMEEVSRRLRDVIASPSAPLLRLVKKEELEKLFTTQRATPWYGQLMTTPQTVAYFLQLNYWLEAYRVELVL